MIENLDETSARGTDPEHEAKIRERAHAIWEREGRPEHSADEHWRRAEREIAGEEGISVPGTPADATAAGDEPARDKQGKLKVAKEPKRKAAKEPKAARRGAAQPAASRPHAANA